MSTRSPSLTLESLAAELQLLRQRVEDLEDARELEAALSRNAGKPLLPWEDVRAELLLDTKL